MAEQRRVAGVVRDVTGDLAPVAGVEERPRIVPAQLGELAVRPGDERPHRDDGEHDEQGGEQTTGAPQPERRQIDGAAAAALLEQQRRDQEPGDDEEHLDPDPPTLHPREPGVVQDHRDNRQRPQPVEAGLVAEPRPPPPPVLDLDRPGRVMVPDDGVTTGRMPPAGRGLRGGVDIELAEPAQRRRVGRQERHA